MKYITAHYQYTSQPPAPYQNIYDFVFPIEPQLGHRIRGRFIPTARTTLIYASHHELRNLTSLNALRHFSEFEYSHHSHEQEDEPLPFLFSDDELLFESIQGETRPPSPLSQSLSSFAQYFQSSAVFIYTYFNLNNIIFDMASAVSKEFDKVMDLSTDGSNYRVWRMRVGFAMGACKASVLSTRLVVRTATAAVGTVGTAGYVAGIAADPDDLIETHDRVLNAITQQLYGSLFTKYMTSTEVFTLLEDLRHEFGVAIAATQAWTEEKMYTLKCTDDRQVIQHLDKLTDMRNSLTDMGIMVDDKSYVNAIITSVPKSYQPIITTITASIDAGNVMRQSFMPPQAAVVVTASQLIRAIKDEANARKI